MVRPKPVLPAGNGEVVEQPAYAEWAGLLEANRAAASAWDFKVGHSRTPMPAPQLRTLARSEALEIAQAFSARLGVDVASPLAPEAPIVLTGHQPELYHPGVWAKVFLAERLATEVTATALDLVVDSDGFENVGITTPCFKPEVRRCHAYLALGTDDGYFAGTSVPSAHDVDEFCSAASEELASLPAPSIKTHFDSFCRSLRSAVPDAENLAELVTFARRRYEAAASTDYLELPMTQVARSEAYLRFFADIIAKAEGFSEAYNAELATYRELNGVRSAAQPVPDLRVEGPGIELPFWALSGAARSAVFVRQELDGVQLMDSEGVQVALLPMGPQSTDDERVSALRSCGAVFAPKALALTLFMRMFVCDLMIHGIGGGRYDRVTDGIIRRFYGVEPPAFVVASMTMYLPLGGHTVTEQEVADATERLNRFEHNPDALIADADFESLDERNRALALSEEKADLIARIAQPDADKKALGGRIREVNAELATLLAPLGEQLRAERDYLKSQLGATEILTDRGYPFCFWSPEEIADKIR